MFKQRALTALVIVPLVLILGYLGGVPFDLFWAAVLAFGGFEFTRMARGAGFKLSYILTIGLILLVSLIRALGLFADILIFPLLLFVSLAYGLWQFEKGEEKALWNVILHVLAAIYIGVLGSFALVMNEGWLNGNWYLLLTIALIWLVDAGAYLIGSRFGKRALLPRLSPNKTLEGFLGGTAAGILGGFLLGWLLKEQLPYITPWKGALLGGIMGPVAFIGDAMMSLFKRTLKVKDTGKLLPGHGGILDRLDSMLWAFVAASIFRYFL